MTAYAHSHLHLFSFPSSSRSVFIIIIFFYWRRTLTPELRVYQPPLRLTRSSPPLTQRQRMEIRGVKSGMQARIISYICPHFLQKMIDSANYSVLPSPSHTTSGCCFGGSQRSLGMCCISGAIWLLWSPVRGEESLYRCMGPRLFWKMVLMTHAFPSSSSPLCRK